MTMSKSPKYPGLRRGSNSTSTSTSLSGRKSGRRTEPKSENRRMWCLRQKAAIWSFGTGIWGFSMGIKTASETKFIMVG